MSTTPDPTVAVRPATHPTIAPQRNGSGDRATVIAAITIASPIGRPSQAAARWRRQPQAMIEPAARVTTTYQAPLRSHRVVPETRSSTPAVRRTSMLLRSLPPDRLQGRSSETAAIADAMGTMVWIERPCTSPPYCGQKTTKTRAEARALSVQRWDRGQRSRGEDAVPSVPTWRATSCPCHPYRPCRPSGRRRPWAWREPLRACRQRAPRW